MEDPTPPVQTVVKPKAGLRAEEVAVDPIPESSGARWSTEESAAATSELGGGEKLASTADESATVPEVTMETAGSLGAEAGAADATPAFEAERPAMPEEQTALSEALEGMVGHAIRTPSPQVVPPAAAEEDEVEEIEREEPRPQAV